jgi:hypothetical protein
MRVGLAVTGVVLLVLFLIVHRTSEQMFKGQLTSILETTTLGYGDPWLKIEYSFGNTYRSVNVLTWSFLCGLLGTALLVVSFALGKVEKRVGKPGLGGPVSPAAVAVGPRFSRKAIVGAVWAMFAVLALPSWFVARPVLDVHAPAPQRIEVASLAPMQVVQPLLAQTAAPVNTWGERSKPTFLFFLGMIFIAVGLTAPIGTTVFGLMALHDIRHSKGMITGLPLALADALIFPLVALDGLLYWFCHLANRVAIEIAPGSELFRKEELVFPAAIVLWLVIDTLLIWLAWRAAKKPVAVG